MGQNQLVVIQRWSAYTVEPVYSGHPWDTTSWLLYRGDLHIVFTHWIRHKQFTVQSWLIMEPELLLCDLYEIYFL